jgi:hypothetical protein
MLAALKSIYLYHFNSVEMPAAHCNNTPCTQKDDFELTKYVIIKKETLVTDYNNLLGAFNAYK